MYRRSISRYFCDGFGRRIGGVSVEGEGGMLSFESVFLGFCLIVGTVELRSLDEKDSLLVARSIEGEVDEEDVEIELVVMVLTVESIEGRTQ